MRDGTEKTAGFKSDGSAEQSNIRDFAIVRAQHATPILRLVGLHYLIYQELTERLPAFLKDGTLPFADLWSGNPLRFIRRHFGISMPGENAAEAAAQSDVQLGMSDPGQVQFPGATAKTPGEFQLNFINSIMGPPLGVVHAEQFDKLFETVSIARDAGFRVVVVDMPLTNWHRQTSLFIAPYEKKLKLTLEPVLRRHEVALVDMSSAVPDSDFRDPSHPMASKAFVWTNVLMARMRPAIGTLVH